MVGSLSKESLRVVGGGAITYILGVYVRHAPMKKYGILKTSFPFSFFYNNLDLT